MFSLYLLFLIHFLSVDLKPLFLGRSIENQDLGALFPTEILGVVRSHHTIAVESFYLHGHFHLTAFLPSFSQCLSRFNLYMN